MTLSHVHAPILQVMDCCCPLWSYHASWRHPGGTQLCPAVSLWAPSPGALGGRQAAAIATGDRLRPWRRLREEGPGGRQEEAWVGRACGSGGGGGGGVGGGRLKTHRHHHHWSIIHGHPHLSTGTPACRPRDVVVLYHTRVRLQFWAFLCVFKAFLGFI